MPDFTDFVRKFVVVRSSSYYITQKDGDHEVFGWLGSEHGWSNSPSGPDLHRLLPIDNVPGATNLAMDPNLLIRLPDKNELSEALQKIRAGTHKLEYDGLGKGLQAKLQFEVN